MHARGVGLMLSMCCTGGSLWRKHVVTTSCILLVYELVRLRKCISVRACHEV